MVAIRKFSSCVSFFIVLDFLLPSQRFVGLYVMCFSLIRSFCELVSGLLL